MNNISQSGPKRDHYQLMAKYCSQSSIDPKESIILHCTSKREKAKISAVQIFVAKLSFGFPRIPANSCYNQFVSQIENVWSKQSVKGTRLGFDRTIDGNMKKYNICILKTNKAAPLKNITEDLGLV